MESAARLARFAAETRYEDVPEPVIQFTKGLILKTISSAIAGAAKPASRRFARLVQERKLNGDIGVIGGGFRTALWEAVTLDAYFAHASELEDDRFGEGISWDITVIPLLFALAEQRKLSGLELMEAIIVGMEVHVRTCMYPTDHLGLVILPGAVGPAVGAARAMRLGANQIEAAMGLSLAGAPLLKVNFGTDAHFLESTMQALHGLLAAETASIGFTSNPNLEVFLPGILGADMVDPRKMTADLGSRWVLNEIWIKKYPCCFLAHRQIDALIEIKNKNGLSIDDVASIEVHASPADIFCDRPNPRTEGDMLFSFQHVLGAALIEGDVHLGHFTAAAMDDPRLAQARSKVRITPHPDWSPETLQAPARIAVTTKGGQVFTKERQFPIGSPSEPLTMDQFSALYAKFTRGLLPAKDIARTADMILNLEKLKDLRPLLDTLTQPPPIQGR